ncbi:UNVERIFIED_CONTAM: hypothetical protein GTU68_063371, partial [Idotea baltica]|nr:hypothetical protein [Idotea baltica]
FSFEFFPPGKNTTIEELKSLIAELSKLGPAFTTCTFRADGTTQKITEEIVAYMQKDLNMSAVSHLTCVGQDKDQINAVLNSLKQNGIDNVLALRGDPPKGQDIFTASPNGFSSAKDLSSYINQNHDFSIAVAGYPEGHTEAVSLDADIDYLKSKQDAGAELIITQLFFDINFYEIFLDKVEKANITIPILPGIMPIRNVGQLKRFTSLCGASIPLKLEEDLNAIEKDSKAVFDFGVQFATEFSKNLIKLGAPGIHFYTLNKEKQIQAVVSNLIESKVLNSFK